MAAIRSSAEGPLWPMGCPLAPVSAAKRVDRPDCGKPMSANFML
jgi:hypothetical protein